MEKVKKVVKNNLATTQTVTKNAFEFLDAACLGIVSYFAIDRALKDTRLHRVAAKVLLFAGALIAIQAFLLLVKHFNKSPAKTGK